MNETEEINKLLMQWACAKKALEQTDEQLRAAVAARDVAERCEREAWVAIEALRPAAARRNKTPPDTAPATPGQPDPVFFGTYLKQQPITSHNLTRYGGYISSGETRY